jgi:hypothetical protein
VPIPAAAQLTVSIRTTPLRSRPKTSAKLADADADADADGDRAGAVMVTVRPAGRAGRVPLPFSDEEQPRAASSAAPTATTHQRMSS